MFNGKIDPKGKILSTANYPLPKIALGPTSSNNIILVWLTAIIPYTVVAYSYVIYIIVH